MGLLDEAIRDHLELKRRRGADPGEIAREAQAALEPVFPDEPRPAELDGEAHATVPGEVPAHAHALVDGAAGLADPLFVGAEVHTATSASVSGTLSEETVELDMEAVLEQDAHLARMAAPESVPSGHGVAHAAVEDELLEWEMPGHSPEPPPEPLPGQERISFE